MTLIYFLSPFVGYLIAGSIKLCINVIINKKFSLNLIGMGGMPSTHTSVVSSPLTLAIIHEGIDQPLVGIGGALLVIVIIDAMDLRRKIGNHAVLINKLTKNHDKLRERTGHNFIEVIGGLLTGIFAGYLLSFC